MILLLGVCLIVMLVSVFFVLNALNQMETLRKQNTVFQKELTQLQQAHQQLLQQLYPAEDPVSEGRAALEAEQAAREQVNNEARDEALETMKEDLFRVQKLLEKHHLKLGYYPDSVDAINRFAEQQQQTPSRHNPYTGMHSPLFDEKTLMDITHDPVDEGLSEYAGRLLYQAHLDPEGRGSGYTLAAFDEEGLLLKTPEGEVLTLEQAA